MTRCVLLSFCGLMSLGLVACSGEDDPETQCVDMPGGCAGVEQAVLGEETWYTEATGQVSCSEILYVKAGAKGGTGTQAAPFGDLPEASSVAVGGSCIALSGGSYQGAELPPSVSVLGKGVAKTTVTGTGPHRAALTVSGSGVLVRGLRLTGEGPGLAIHDATQVEVRSALVEEVLGMGISVRDATGILIAQVRVAGVVPATAAANDVGVGILVERGDAIQVIRSLVERCQGSGLIHYGNELVMEGSVIRRNDEYGVAATCWASPCVPAPMITIRGSLIEENRGVSIWLTEVAGTLDEVIVRGTARDDTGFSRSLEGINLPDLEVLSSTIETGEDLGVLLHSSHAVIRDSIVAGHLGRGIWIQDPRAAGDSMVEILNSEVVGNAQVGIGALGSCTVMVMETELRGTILAGVPTDTGHVEQGDGLQALPGSIVAVDRVLFEDNDRQSILADDVSYLTVVGSTFLDAAADPILVQNIGVDDINQATNIESGDNQGIGGAAVAPVMPPHPLGLDTSEISVSVPRLL